MALESDFIGAAVVHDFWASPARPKSTCAPQEYQSQPRSKEGGDAGAIVWQAMTPNARHILFTDAFNLAAAGVCAVKPPSNAPRFSAPL